MSCTIHPSQTVRKSTLISLLWCFSLLLLTSCEGPEVTERHNNYTKTNADSYTLDIYMLAEWAGRIIPERNLATFNLKKTDDGKIFAKGYEDTDLSSVLKFDASDNLFFYPYGTDNTSDKYSPAFTCNPNSLTVPDSNGFQKYTCEIYRSGTDAIYNVWKTEAGDSQHKSIFIGSGDNFGVSLPVSSKQNDYPAVQMMNKLGITAETFGNHNFDYSLSDLQELIEAANFPFVISNFFNLPNNIEHTTGYTIVDIPPDDGKGEKLHLAILGAFDHNAMDIISRGRFGTLTIDDYCPLINFMEEAFNKNARAFLVLSHVFTDKSSIQEFFNGLFYFSQQFADAVDKVNNSSDKDKSLIENYPCNSHLIITQEMLDSYRQYLKGQKDSKANTISVKDLRKAIYQQIFDNILMVYGEASFYPFLTPLYPGNDKSELKCPKQGEQSDPMIKYHINGCTNDSSGESDENTGIVNLFYNASLLSTQNLPENIKLTEDEALKVLKFSRQEFEISPSEDDDHPIWFAELSPKGYETAKATFHITKVSTPIKSSAAFYKSDLTSFKRIPVFGKPFSTSSDTTQTNLTTYDDAHCKEYLSNIKICAEYFEGYKNYVIGKEEKKPDVKSCRDALMSNKTLSISELENAWACIYYVTQWEYREDDKKFINEPICSFGNYIIAGENKDNEIRKYSTFLTNFITDTFFRAMDDIDAVYINAGNIRESRDFSIIDNEFLNMALPFSNALVKLSLSVKELVSILEFGLKADISGVFPAIAGLRLSYSLDKDRNPVIEELWQVSENKIDDSSIEYETGYGKEYYTPLYMSESTIKTKHCLFSAQKDGKCVFGEFNPTSKKLNQSKTITLLINSYMQSGGDNFPVFDKNQYTEIGVDVLDFFKGVLRKDKETSLCTLYISDEKIYDTDYILTHNLIKRIYNISEPYIGEFGYAMDYREQICVATQQSLFEEIAASGSIESPPCNYITGTSAASSAAGSENSSSP